MGIGASGSLGQQRPLPPELGGTSFQRASLGVHSELFSTPILPAGSGVAGFGGFLPPHLPFTGSWIRNFLRTDCLAHPHRRSAPRTLCNGFWGSEDV